MALPFIVSLHLNFSHNEHQFDFAMYLDSTKKKEFFATFGANEKDTGSAEAQIAMFSYRIAHLTEHLKQNRKITTHNAR